MDETGLYWDSIAPYTWTSVDNKEAYVCLNGIKRRDVLVGTYVQKAKDLAGLLNFVTKKQKRLMVIKWS